MTLTLTEFASSALILLLGMIAIIVVWRVRHSRRTGSPYAVAGGELDRAVDHPDVQYYRIGKGAEFPPLKVNLPSGSGLPIA